MAELLIRQPDGLYISIPVEVHGEGVVINSWEAYAEPPESTAKEESINVKQV